MEELAGTVTHAASRRVSRADKASHFEPHRHFTTFQPAPAHSDSSSSPMQPLPRAGPTKR